MLRRQVCAVVKAEGYMHAHIYICVKMSIYNRCSVSMDAEAARRFFRRDGERKILDVFITLDLSVGISYLSFALFLILYVVLSRPEPRPTCNRSEM